MREALFYALAMCEENLQNVSRIYFSEETLIVTHVIIIAIYFNIIIFFRVAELYTDTAEYSGYATPSKLQVAT